MSPFVSSVMRNVPGHREQQGHRVLGGGYRIPAGSVHHDNASPGGSIDIDVVHTGPSPSDNLQVRSCTNNLSAHLRSTPDDQHVVVGYDRLQLIGRKVWFLDDFESFRDEDVGANLLDGITEKYFHSAFLVWIFETGLNRKQRVT
jgi:hypothetical protein